MGKELVSDELWSVIEPLLPVEPAKPKGGRPRVADRAALTGILFVLRTGIPWEYLPPELGCGSGMTCWRRLKSWHEAGVWASLHTALLEKLAQAEKLDWSRACLDSSSVAAPLAKKGVKPTAKKALAPTRQTVANRERSATLWSTPTVRR
jgi:transposase